MTGKRGGHRAGSGRKKLGPEIKKAPTTIKLPPWLLDWMRGQKQSRAQLIEVAMRNFYNIGPPGDE